MNGYQARKINKIRNIFFGVQPPPMGKRPQRQNQSWDVPQVLRP